MEITFDLTRDDFWLFQRSRIRGMWTQRRVARSGAAVAVFLGVLAFVTGKPPVVPFLVGMAVAALYAAVVYLATKRYVMGAASKSNGIVGRHTVAVDADGVRDTTEVTDERVGWRGIESVEQLPELVVLNLDRLRAVVVPRRAFADHQEEERFATTVRTLYARGRT
jgi:hypothetical protein